MYFQGLGKFSKRNGTIWYPYTYLYVGETNKLLDRSIRTYLTYVWRSGLERKNLGPKVESSHVSTTYTESENGKIKIF